MDNLLSIVINHVGKDISLIIFGYSEDCEVCSHNSPRKCIKNNYLYFPHLYSCICGIKMCAIHHVMFSWKYKNENYCYFCYKKENNDSKHVEKKIFHEITRSMTFMISLNKEYNSGYLSYNNFCNEENKFETCFYDFLFHEFAGSLKFCSIEGCYSYRLRENIYCENHHNYFKNKSLIFETTNVSDIKINNSYKSIRNKFNTKQKEIIDRLIKICIKMEKHYDFKFIFNTVKNLETSILFKNLFTGIIMFIDDDYGYGLKDIKQISLPDM